MAQVGTSENPNNTTADSIRLEDLFDSSRILVKPKLYKAVFYFPFALFLLLTRLVAVIFAFSILSLLPKTSPKRSLVLKGFSRILGIVVEVDDKYNDENAKLLIANHVSLWDRLAVNVMFPCCSIAKDFQIRNTDALSFWDDSDIPFPREYTIEEVSTLRRSIQSSSTRVLHFPEFATTNGKIGLLKFHPGIFSINTPVQPVLIHASFSSYMTIAPSVLGSNIWADILWPLFLPTTFFKLKILPSMVKLPEESVNDFTRRVQQSMASALNLSPTVYTSSDKKELIKRLEMSSAAASVARSSISLNIPSSSKHPSGLQRSSHLSSSPPQKLSMNTAAGIFGRSPKERMTSYQERKRMLLEAARQKYLEKHSM
ncbi:lipid droplet-regulating VLDL assembly factor AUP1-like [Argiope bruennichi]|uniref:lipid droplet-regulating VLDL assembly factor AUP1-like n=1 Tax=Argiope bruennichi TaxID=94029 RepID=UPI002494DDEC|nr:lipid droplet-regulating VLDL assembly factor AUP1-like [Argiope bruennichi]